MINYQNIIFSLFPARDKRNDVNKNALGKGTLERYNEVVGLCIDEELVVLIENLVDRCIAVDSCEAKFIPYLETRVGNTLGETMYATEAYRRAVLRHVMSFYKIKGTPRLLKILLGMLGLSVVITENFTTYGLDSPLTFDDPVRVFDKKCNTCSTYALDLTDSSGNIEITPALFLAVMASIQFNEPINAHLVTGSYNGGPLVYFVVTVTIDAAGGLVYSNPYDPNLVIQQNPDGTFTVVSGFTPYYTFVSPNEFVFLIGDLGSFNNSFSIAFSN